MRLACACAVLLACTHPHEPPIATPPPGVEVALYADRAGSNLAIIDDRRWIDVVGEHLVLEDVADDVAVPSLVLEVLSGPGHLAIGACARARMVDGGSGSSAEMPSGLGSNAVPPPPPEPDGDVVVPPRLPLAPTMRCATSGPAGRYLLRVLYSSTALAFHAEHAITITTPDRAHIATNLSITTPIWRHRDGVAPSALVTAFEGLPGGEALPVQLGRDRVVLDGSTGVIHFAARDVSARVRRVLSASNDITGSDSPPGVWAQERTSADDNEPDAYVWIWLELPGTHLAPGNVLFHVDYPGEIARDVNLPAETRVLTPDNETATVTRLPMWADEGLRGSIQRSFSGTAETLVKESFNATVLNYGEVPREIFVEEPLRHDGKRVVASSWPTKPGLVGDTLRTKLAVAPGKVERAGFVVNYLFNVPAPGPM
jgi:hypothetical protein